MYRNDYNMNNYQYPQEFQDDIEFLQYQDTAPAAFLAMFNHKLDTLREWGLEVRSLDDLTVSLCSRDDAGSPEKKVTQTAPERVSGSVITKRDRKKGGINHV